MDLLGGEVVHAVGGERERYEPVESVLVDSSHPLFVSSKFEEMGFGELYVADLDSIQKKGDNLEALEEIMEKCGIKPMVDAGFESADDAKKYVDSGLDKIVLATETLRGFKEVRKAKSKYDVEVVASLDIKDDDVISGSGYFERPISEIADRFEEFGADELILLDLGRVGSSGGPNLELLNRVSECTEIELLVGGGIRDAEDIRRLKEAGASGVLIATALHSGAVKWEDVEDL